MFNIKESILKKIIYIFYFRMVIVYVFMEKRKMNKIILELGGNDKVCIVLRRDVV